MEILSGFVIGFCNLRVSKNTLNVNFILYLLACVCGMYVFNVEATIFRSRVLYIEVMLKMIRCTAGLTIPNTCQLYHCYRIHIFYTNLRKLGSDKAAFYFTTEECVTMDFDMTLTETMAKVE